VNTWKVIFATLVIFIAGVVTGGLLVSYADRAQQKQHRVGSRDAAIRRLDGRQPAAGLRDSGPRESLASSKMPGAIPKILRLDFLQSLDREIRLTEDQRRRIEKIISEGQERNRQLWSRVQPDIRREIQETRERIRAVLRPDQVRRYEELMKQRPQRKADESLIQPDRRLRDQTRRPFPSRERPPTGSPLPPHPPVESPTNP